MGCDCSCGLVDCDCVHARSWKEKGKHRGKSVRTMREAPSRRLVWASVYVSSIRDLDDRAKRGKTIEVERMEAAEVLLIRTKRIRGGKQSS